MLKASLICSGIVVVVVVVVCCRPIRIYDIKLVRCCAYQVDNPQFFGFITIQPDSMQHCACHVFQFDRSSVSIVNAIA